VNAVPPNADEGSAAAQPPPQQESVPVPARLRLAGLRGGWLALLAAMLLGIVASLLLAWRSEQRVMSLEQELVKRQIDSAGQSAEARLLAKRAEEGMGDMAAKVALLEGRVAEVALQRGQVEDLLQSLSRSRDENLVVDIEAAIRVALQQNAITGSAEPLVATLRQSDERLARYNQPRLEGVRRAIARDLDRVKAAAVTDISTLTIKLDDAIRIVDELPLLAKAEPRKEPTRPATAAAGSAPARGDARGNGPAWLNAWGEAWRSLWLKVWLEARSLVRVTPIDHPDAMLLTPEQAFFFRENLKLRLLNARLSLLSRQFGTAQVDLRNAQSSLERYFDKTAKRTQLAVELIRQVAAQARQVGVPRPDDTLAALAAANAGR
jgi:uroporphyrin-3 C-methyltransferase